MNEDMKMICDVKDKVLDLLHKANRADEFSMGDVDFLANALKAVKDACEVEEMMDDGGYSQATDWPADGTYGRGSSYANRGHNMGRNGGRDTGRDGGMGTGYSSRRNKMGRYSRDDGRSEMMEYIAMAIDAADGEDKETLKRFMRQIENA